MRKFLLIALSILIFSGLYAQEQDTLKRNLPDTIRVIEPDSAKMDVSDSLRMDLRDSVRMDLSDSLRMDLQDTSRMDPSDLRRTARVADTLPKILRNYTLSRDFSEEINLPVDTIFNMSQRYRRADKYSPLNAMLGNYGLPTYQLNFFDRPYDQESYLYRHYYPFMYIPERAIFMDTQIPFTELFWTIAGNRRTSEQTFRVKHSQNINRFWNFGVIYDIIFSLGQYSYQRSDNKNFTFFTSYTGNRYEAYFSAGVNNLTSFENGGIIDPQQLADYGNMRDVAVNLGGTNNAKSILKNRNLLLVQRYTMGGSGSAANGKQKEIKSSPGISGTFSHIFAFENNRQMYLDEFPASGFYDSIFMSTNTKDSLYSSYVKNTVRFDFTVGENRKFRLGGGGGIRNEVHRFSQVIPTFDTLFADTTGRTRVSNALTGKLYNNIGSNFRWSATGDLYFRGYRSGDFNLDGVITKSFDFRKGKADWNITGGLSNRQPSYWMQNWGSNNFFWRRNLDKEFRMNVGTSFSFPARNFNLKVNYAIIDNYTGFGMDAMPFQHSGGLSVGAMTLSKDFRAWKLHLSTDVTLQQSSNTDVLDLPIAAFRSAFYFEHLFKFPSTDGQLNSQIGAEILYHTEYHPWAYMPATGRFYNQDSYTAGNYPFINVFLNLKLKRTRIFFVFDHFNSGRNGFDFFMVPSYPMSLNVLRYGFAWTFYD